MKPKRPNFYLHLHLPKIPKREGSFFYTFGLGGISIFLFLVLFVTGMLEVFYYIPSGAEANRSLQIITFLVPYGNLIRGLHFWAAQLLVGTSILHMLRVVLTGSYKAPRRFNWLLGSALLILTLFLNFTGYALRWDTDISWALLVGTNLLKLIPWVGDSIYTLTVGGNTIGDYTLVRLYAWHIYGLALVAVIIIVWHIFRVRRDGGISSLKEEKPIAKIRREQLVEKEVITMLAVSILLLTLAIFFPPGLQGPADFNNIPENATAPWFFVWVQVLLERGEALQMGVLVPLGLLTLIVILPYVLDRSTSGEAKWFNKEGWLAQFVILVMILGMVALTIWGTVN